MRIHQRVRRATQGNSIIEFGRVFPVIFAFLTGTFQLGYGFFLYDQLQSVVRSGARYASTADFDSTQGGAGFQSNAANVVAYGSPTGGTPSLESSTLHPSCSACRAWSSGRVPEPGTAW